jgi:signal peptidase II
VTFFADERIRRAGVVAAVVLAADQLTKWIVDATMAPDGQIAVLPVFALTYTRNPGAAFGILAAVPPGVRLPLFFAITIVAVGAVLSFIRKTRPTSAGSWERWAGSSGGRSGTSSAASATAK